MDTNMDTNMDTTFNKLIWRIENFHFGNPKEPPLEIREIQNFGFEGVLIS